MMRATHEYYAKHSRKISSSQTNLSEQLQDDSNDNASRSMTYLPATSYLDTTRSYADANEPTTPDTFYRQYHEQYAQSAGAPLRQGALRTTDLDTPDPHEDGAPMIPMDDRREVYGNGLLAQGQETTRSYMSSPGLRNRKSSVKNLVAQINASYHEDLPPMPSNSASRGSSRNISPVILAEAQFQPADTSRHFNASARVNTLQRYRSNVETESRNNTVATDPSYTASDMGSHTRRPLFGEVVTNSSRLPVPGYGIQTTRRRSGSEDSPMLNPNTVNQYEASDASRTNYHAITSSHTDDTLSSDVYDASRRQLHHRRANSESPMTPNRNRNNIASVNLPPTSNQSKNYGGSSRIPVSIRRGSTSSDLDVRSTSAASNSATGVSTLVPPGKSSSASQRQLPPPQIQSPGQRGKNTAVPQGPKSPSLRANIIVPPPKISPPLRSSRPRQTVSSASTAASRAKMAEKFSALQKINDEKRQMARRAAKPPELSDIDLKARRLRITQALSRSLEGQELQGNSELQKPRATSTSRTTTPAFSDDSQSRSFSVERNGLPDVVIDTAPSVTESDNHTPVDGRLRQERSFSQNALDAMQGSKRPLSADDDSPTLGPDGFDYLNPIQTNIQSANQDYGPLSAVTEGTTIDPEPQDGFQQRSLGSARVNHTNGTGNRSDVRESTYTVFSDHADLESVNLVLRDTTYLDDDEAIRKGYRPAFDFSQPLPQSSSINQSQRQSWTSSIEVSDQDDDAEYSRFSDNAEQNSHEEASQSSFTNERSRHEYVDESVRSTMASDAYTIVNIVLQQHSTSGIVDQQFVDDVYHRILEDSPFGNENNLNADRIEQICLQEIQDREESWYKPNVIDKPLPKEPAGVEDDIQTPTKKSTRKDRNQRNENDWLAAQPENLTLAPPPTIKGHRYKSSLDSAEDWAETSPSVSDWIRFAADETQQTNGERPDLQNKKPEDSEKGGKTRSDMAINQFDETDQDVKEDEDLYSAPRPRKRPQTPPPPPNDQKPSTERSPYGTAMIQRPRIPRRVTSISHIGRITPQGRESPSVSAPVLPKLSTEDVISPEQRRLKQRRNVIKELVDTEFTYEKDLKVLCDIYKQTASAALGEEDIRVLFGNVDQVQVFSKDFLMLLKSLAKPTYTMERLDRKKDKNLDKVDSSGRSRSSSSTLASAKVNDNEPPTAEKDRETRIGQAFEASLADMEIVYTEYIKNRHAANLRLEVVQKSPSACEWLKECKDNSSDITNAWNLDALLVKPVQRITKYPLLLKELVDATSEDHPDLSFLRRALHEMTEVNIRINDVKKHAELVDQVLNRKRKDSDVRAGLSKAFGRRAEKIKQHVGITELYEDSKYNEIKIHYDNNIVQLMVVGNDCSSYGRSITKWVNKMVEIAAAAEAWVDVGHSNHQEAESKLRQFAMVVRGISTIALPDHLEHLNNKVLVPMQQAVDLMTRFKTDPKGLLLKREKRMLDYAQIKSKKERGEKIDRKMIERMEQSEALNVEAKERMRKLVTATAKLVQACQINLIQMQTTWQNMVRQKLSAAMGIPLENLDVEDITKEWQLDFDYQEASALSLGVCNGSLLAEATNMMNFQASSTTLNGEESPRPSFTSASKQSISGTSENSYPPIPDYDPRTSAAYGHHYQEYSIPYANPRGRAQSAASSKYARTPELSQQGSATEGFPNFVRHDSAPAPRLSVETPSPLIGVLQPEPSRRPMSSSTFFSASGTPPPTQQSRGSSIFSSAMPMSDSPVVERFPEHHVVEPDVLFTAASVHEFNIDRSRREAGFPYLTYVTGEIFDVIGERGELWLAKNQDDPQRQIGWIWNKHFAKLAV